jgi:tetratricopeptide (TPR) repeat protein
VKSETPSNERKRAVAEDESLADKRVAKEAAVIKQRIESDPSNANAYLQLAEIYRRNGQFDQARSLLQKGLGPTGNNFDLSAELLDLEIEPFRQNLTITEQRLHDNPDDEELRRIRIRLLKEINARELEMFRMKAGRYPTDQSHRLELGVRLLRAGQVDEAIRELQGARSDPRIHWKCLHYLGHCFKTRNNWKLARRNFEESLHNLPSNEEGVKKEIFFQLAQGCAEAGELPDAVNFATELANLDFSYRDIGKLLDEWQERLKQE